MSLTLSSVILWNATDAGTGTSFNLDYRHDGTQNRRLRTTQNAGDTISIEATLDGTNWFSIASHTGGTAFTDSLSGPYVALRVVKTGAAGAALVTGII